MTDISPLLKLGASASSIIVAALTIAIGYAVIREEITILKGILLIIFGSLTAISFYKLFLLIGSGKDSLGVERSVPAVDGTISGWKLTPSLTMLIITIAFGTITLLVSLNDFQKNRMSIDTTKEEKKNEQQVQRPLSKTDSAKTLPKDSLRKARDSGKIDTGKTKSSK